MKEKSVDYEEYWQRRFKERKVKVVKRHEDIVRIILSVRTKGKVLDLGCGERHILRMIPDTFERYGCEFYELPYQQRDMLYLEAERNVVENLSDIADNLRKSVKER